MKKILLLSLSCIIFIASILTVLNIEVTSQQGINYEWHLVKLPLYLKILDFFDRHYNYKVLVKNITASSKAEEERALAVFDWVKKNIKRVPANMPVVDDHVWYTITRGYGARDQFSDIFTTLCNYANLEAFYLWVYPKDGGGRLPLSFVKVKQKWTLFDPYEGVYFRNRTGQLANINDLKTGNWTMIGPAAGFNYDIYFVNLSSVNTNAFRRSNIQSPIRRLIYQVWRWCKR